MATTSSCTRTPMSSLLMMPDKPSTNASGFPAVFVVFYIHEMTIRGVYSSLELAKENAESYFKPEDVWCIQEQVLDGNPSAKFNNVYQNQPLS